MSGDGAWTEQYRLWRGKNALPLPMSIQRRDEFGVFLAVDKPTIEAVFCGQRIDVASLR